MIRKYNTALLLFSLWCLPLIALAQTPQENPVASLFDHWYSGDTSTIRLTITTDLSQLFRHADREEYQSATIQAGLNDGLVETYEGKIRLRGNIRREICQLPPLKLKFSKKDLGEKGLLPHNELKLVIPCRNNVVSEQDLISEFLTYRMYENLYPMSLRVQMMHLRLIDSEGKKPDQEFLAFIIEPIETLAARFNMKESERTAYRDAFLEKWPYRQMAFFQYMIGNTDWNVFNSHNLYFIGGEPYTRLVPIPYDFDYSAVVGTQYAVPHESLPIKAVTQRLYRGLSCEEKEALELIETFADKETVLLEPIQTYPLLSEGKRKEMLHYLDGFFRQLEKTKGMVWELGQ